MAQNFRGCLFRCFGVNCPWIVRSLWVVAKPMLSEFTLQKILILGANHKEDLLKTISEDCLEEKFGGKLPNKTDNFFPPELV